MRWAVQAALPECSLLLLEDITVTVGMNTNTAVTNSAEVSPRLLFLSFPAAKHRKTKRQSWRCASALPLKLAATLRPAHFISALALHTLFLITHIFSGWLWRKECWWERAQFPGPSLWCDVISLSVSHSFLRTPQVCPKDLWTLLSIERKKYRAVTATLNPTS